MLSKLGSLILVRLSYIEFCNFFFFCLRLSVVFTRCFCYSILFYSERGIYDLKKKQLCHRNRRQSLYMKKKTTAVFQYLSFAFVSLNVCPVF